MIIVQRTRVAFSREKGGANAPFATPLATPLDANSLVRAIKDCLLRLGLQISCCRGQCYDGASDMSGSKNGVATQICSEEKRALYVHCHAHALNLAVGDCIKHSKVCREALETAFEISRLIKFSPKRNAAFDKIKT